MQQEEDKYWILISRYLANELSDTETDELLVWVNDKPAHAELLQQMQNAWDKSDDYLKTNEPEINVDSAWTKVEQRLFVNEKKKAKVISIKSYKWIGIAASLLLLVGMGWFSVNYHQKNTTIVFVNELHEGQQILLPDGSSVWLSSESELSYKKGLDRLSVREVALRGEGFFEVKHDVKKPFIIHSGGTQTQVLGTSFNVSTTKDGLVKVAVITGKVSFKQENANEGLFLLPGEEGVYSKTGGVSKTKFKSTNFMYWKTKSLSFENETLANVLSQLAGVYQVKFSIEDQNLLNRKITTNFHSASVDQVINVLETVLDVKIEKSNDAYIVVK